MSNRTELIGERKFDFSLAVWQLAVWQLAVGSWQSAVGSWQLLPGRPLTTYDLRLTTYK